MKQHGSRCLTCLLMAAGLLAALLPAQGDGREMRRNIFRLGFTLGEANALMEKHPNDPNYRRMISTTDDLAIPLLRLIIADYQAPFTPDGLNYVIQRLEAFDAQAAGMNGEQIAAYFESTRGVIKQSLALTYGMETQGQFNTEPTCDSCLMDLGYHLGRLAVFAADVGNSNRSSALSGINQALITGRHCVEHLRCAFLSMEDWDSLNVPAAATGQQVYQIRAQLEERIFGLVSSAVAPFGIPSSPRIARDPSGKWHYDKIIITREGNQYVARAYLGFTESSKRQYGVFEGVVWFVFDAQPRPVAGFTGPVFVGKHIFYNDQHTLRMTDCYFELETKQTSAGKYFQVLRFHQTTPNGPNNGSYSRDLTD